MLCLEHRINAGNGVRPYSIINMANQRTGLPTIRAVSNRLCNYVTTFTPVITKAFPANAALIAALAAANAACAVLVAEADAQLPIGD